MNHSSDGPTPPEGLPDRLVKDLQALSPEELRKAIIYAEELLQFHEETEFPIEPQPGEDILRVNQHEGYVEVVKQHYCGDDCEDCPHGPYLYHVTEEPHPDGKKRVHWSYIGEVDLDEQ